MHEIVSLLGWGQRRPLGAERGLARGPRNKWAGGTHRPSRRAQGTTSVPGPPGRVVFPPRARKVTADR